MLYVGIDGGLNGGITVLGNNGYFIATFNMPILKLEKNEFDIKGIVDIFTHIKNDLCMSNNMTVILEKAHTRPIQGIRAAFTTGYGLGIMEGILISMGISYEVVNPTTWMKAVFEGSYSKENKKYSTIWATRKFPDVEWKRGKNIHDGLTDSCAISYYGFIKYNGGIKNG